MKDIQASDLEGTTDSPAKVKMWQCEVKFCSAKKSIKNKCEVKSGQCLIVPMGSFVAERVVPVTPASGAALTNQEIKESYALGFRIHYLNREESEAFKTFKAMYDDYATYLNKMSRNDDQTSAFWQRVITTVGQASPGAAASSQSTSLTALALAAAASSGESKEAAELPRRPIRSKSAPSNGPP